MIQDLIEADIQYANLGVSTWGEDDTTIEYGYDDNGSMTSKTTKETLSGDIIETVVYEYNLQSRLAKVTTTPYISGSPQMDSVTEYKYDPDGNRVEKITEGVSTKYLIDSMNPTGYSQVFVEKTGDNRTAYIIGDDILVQATGTGQTDIQYPLYDGHGSTRQLTDSTGAPVTNESYSYDAYGVLLGGPRATDTSLLYTGEQWDNSAQMYYLRARYYDPMNGRFSQVDPFAGSPQDPQSLHKYLYAHDNPVNGIDPSGKYPVGGIALIIGLIIFNICMFIYVQHKFGPHWTTVKNKHQDAILKVPVRTVIIKPKDVSEYPMFTSSESDFYEEARKAGQFWRNIAGHRLLSARSTFPARKSNPLFWTSPKPDGLTA